MSETQHRIIEAPLVQNEWLEPAKEALVFTANHVTEFSVDAWYWLVNYVQSAPERKVAVITAAGLAILLVLMLIKQTRLF